MTAEVVHIHITPKAEATMVSIAQVRAFPGRGLEGDRYFEHSGTYSETPGTGRDITLIEIEQLDGVAAEHGLHLEPGATRRNVTTRGVSLNELVDKEFQVGEVTVRGTRLCEPCEYLEGLVGKQGLVKVMLHRAGLRCDIITEGNIHVGDPIVVP